MGAKEQKEAEATDALARQAREAEEAEGLTQADVEWWTQLRLFDPEGPVER